MALLGNAKHLRVEMTDAERKLWAGLRGRRLGDAKVRRQVPIGPYIADFLCFEKRLVIEVDGSQHFESETDAVRDAWFIESGYRTMRFTNYDVLANLDAVLETIWSALDRDTGDHRPLLPSREKVPGRADEGGSMLGERSP